MCVFSSLNGADKKETQIKKKEKKKNLLRGKKWDEMEILCVSSKLVQVKMAFFVRVYAQELNTTLCAHTQTHAHTYSNIHMRI